MVLPPWLQGPDVLGAMRGGAALGLSARAQDQAAEEFAAHLALQHDQLNAQQAQHAATLAQAQARAAEALRQHNALEIYRQKNLEQQAQLRRETMAQQQTSRDALNALSESRLRLSEESGRRQEESGKRAEAMLQLQMDRENRLASGKEASLNALAAAAKELPADDPRRAAIDDLIAQKAGIPNVQSPAVKALMDEYIKLKHEPKSGKTGTFLGFGGMQIPARMEQIAKELQGLGWTPEGTRLGGAPAAAGLNDSRVPTIQESNKAQEEAQLGAGTNLPTNTPTVKEVKRKTKDGRIAIFNADTKEFIRYAD